MLRNARRSIALGVAGAAGLLAIGGGVAVAERGPISFKGSVSPEGGLTFDVEHPDSNLRPTVANLKFGHIRMVCQTPQGTENGEIGGEDSNDIRITPTTGDFDDTFNYDGAQFTIKGTAQTDRHGINADKPITGTIKLDKITGVNCYSARWDWKAKPQS
jgi:hypothetical protein